MEVNFKLPKKKLMMKREIIDFVRVERGCKWLCKKIVPCSGLVGLFIGVTGSLLAEQPFDKVGCAIYTQL